MCNTSWQEEDHEWYWIIMITPVVNSILAMLVAAIGLIVQGKELDRGVNSVHLPEGTDESQAGQTTTRHKPKTRLSSADPRSLEEGEETVARTRAELELKTNTNLRKEYDAWVKEIAAELRFGDPLTEEEKDDLTIRLFSYRELSIKNTSAPPAIDRIEHALYFRIEQTNTKAIAEAARAHGEADNRAAKKLLNTILWLCLGDESGFCKEKGWHSQIRNRL